MGDAGRILIIPRGNYDANIEYEMLDLVFNGGTSWLAKKNSKGIAPTDENSENWMKVFDADALIDSKIEAKVKEYLEQNS